MSLRHVLLAHGAHQGGLLEACPLVPRPPPLAVGLLPARGAESVSALLRELLEHPDEDAPKVGGGPHAGRLPPHALGVQGRGPLRAQRQLLLKHEVPQLPRLRHTLPVVLEVCGVVRLGHDAHELLRPGHARRDLFVDLPPHQRALAPPGREPAAVAAQERVRDGLLGHREGVVAELGRGVVLLGEAREAEVAPLVCPLGRARRRDALVARARGLLDRAPHAHARLGGRRLGRVLDLGPGLHEPLREAVPDHGPVRHRRRVPERLRGVLVEVVEHALLLAPELLPGRPHLPPVPPRVPPPPVAAPGALDEEGGPLAGRQEAVPVAPRHVGPVRVLEAHGRAPPLLGRLDRLDAKQERRLHRVPRPLVRHQCRARAARVPRDARVRRGGEGEGGGPLLASSSRVLARGQYVVGPLEHLVELALQGQHL
mmetsp:Transcript_61073/g.138151  ORF Transcript_61073/g.138151 Transcript_61073/m.138151 type:complete len:427 (+) Transcript_61073:910-2190(+)